MEDILLEDLKRNWLKIGHSKSPMQYELELKLYNKLISFFQVGDYYYLLFVPTEGRVSNVSESVRTVLGYQPKQFTTDFFLKSVHPDDLPVFVDFEAAVVEFKTQLPPDKIMKYKSRYNFRIQKANGDYIHILQQSITIQTDEQGAALLNLVVHTDISEFKTDNNMQLSFIGLEGEPSYVNYKTKIRIATVDCAFTRREKEIINLIARNYSSAKIAEVLDISPSTVRTHRRNINAKAEVSNPLELITKALKNGWL